MKCILLSIAIAVAACAQTVTQWPTGNRTTPPTINSVSPLGVARGATVEMFVEGLNLSQASAVYLSDPGVKARVLRTNELPDLSDIRLGSNGTPSTVDLGPLPPHNQVILDVEVSPDTPIGMITMRLQTPLGTSSVARFAIEPYYGESPDREPNDTPQQASETYLPTVLVGVISKPGDVDYYKINVTGGEQLVFHNSGLELGSSLEPVVRIYDANQNLAKQFGAEGGREGSSFAYTFVKGGAYYLSVSDFDGGGDAGHFYRIKVGRFPLVTAAFPLGLQKGKTATIQIGGYNLSADKVDVKGEPSPEEMRVVILRPHGAKESAFNRVKLALGSEPEVPASGANTTLAQAQAIIVPVTVNAKLEGSENYYRFHARKGEKLIFEVNASRLSSPLDSLLEIIDTNGTPVEQATIRCILETSTTLFDSDSSRRGIRFTSAVGFAVGDYMMIGAEILQVHALPNNPDDDFTFTSFGDQRLGRLDTTPEAHPIDQPAYKVQIYPPGEQFTPNGLPVIHLPFRNDDGGAGYGKDSLLHFTAPAHGEYVVRLRDVRAFKGPDYVYRLTVRRPSPDFMLSVSPRNPNVPLGGRVPITVTALRLDEFDGPIEVSLKAVPPGFHATNGAIGAGQISTTLTLSADDNAKLARAAPLEVVGRARLGNQWEERWANLEDRLKLISVMPKPDIVMRTATKQVVLRPQGTAEVELALHRNNNFGGRVLIDVRNLPPGVQVMNVGSSGLLMNETDNRCKFTIKALPTARPIEQPMVVTGEIETRAGGQQNLYAAEPVILKILPPSRESALSVNGALQHPL